MAGEQHRAARGGNFSDSRQSRHPKRRSSDDDNDNDDLPQPFDATKLHAPKKRQRSTSPSSSNPGEAPRKLKRPGQRARISEAEREQIRQRALSESVSKSGNL